MTSSMLRMVSSLPRMASSLPRMASLLPRITSSVLLSKLSRWQSGTRTQDPLWTSGGVRFMGSNIHLYTEKLVGGTWVSAKKLLRNEWYNKSDDDEPEYKLESIYEERNYDLFAILADVRNDYNITPIIKPRGLPFPMSPEVEFEVDRYKGGITRSYSYLTLRELEKFGWAGQTFEAYGCLSASWYREYKGYGKPYASCRSMGGRHVTRKQMEQLIAETLPKSRT